ncbi:MAG: nitrous oxide reductase accessory protein NosL [Syntrophobacteraceae bacterium]
MRLVTKYTVLLFIVILAANTCFAAEAAKPSKTDKCPVCGMFVHKYPDFLAQVVFKDGSRAFFDGAKDMFHYYFNLQKYDKAKKKEDIASIFVTDYYSLTAVDGTKAIYIVGSDVEGPMGRELIPFEKAEDADEFTDDHQGKKRLLFDEITFDLVKSLD